MQQLRAEMAELKALLLEVRKHQKRSTLIGVLKVVVYLVLIGGSAFALKSILPRGLQGLTATYNLDDQASSTGSIAPPNLQDIFKSLREIQSGQ
jgi:hypothetical protein